MSQPQSFGLCKLTGAGGRQRCDLQDHATADTKGAFLYQVMTVAGVKGVPLRYHRAPWSLQTVQNAITAHIQFCVHKPKVGHNHILNSLQAAGSPAKPPTDPLSQVLRAGKTPSVATVMQSWELHHCFSLPPQTLTYGLKLYVSSRTTAVYAKNLESVAGRQNKGKKDHQNWFFQQACLRLPSKFMVEDRLADTQLHHYFIQLTILACPQSCLTFPCLYWTLLR